MILHKNDNLYGELKKNDYLCTLIIMQSYF